MLKSKKIASSANHAFFENAFALCEALCRQVYRNRTKDFDDNLMLTAAGLWNFYLMAA